MYYPFYIIYLHLLPTLDSIPQIKLNTIDSKIIIAQDHNSEEYMYYHQFGTVIQTGEDSLVN